MVVPVTNIVEKGFSLQDTKDKHLSLLIGPDRLSYLVTNASNREILALSAYSFQGKADAATLPRYIIEVVKADTLFNAEYANVNISLYTKRFTLIPNELYDSSQHKVYFGTTIQTDNNDELFVDELNSIQAHLIYSIHTELDTLLTDTFPDAQRSCTAGSLIRNILIQHSAEENLVVALLQARSICLTVLHKGKLLLHQIYGFQNAEDCLYYVLLTYKSLGLSTEKHPILLAGELIQDSEIYKLLYQYIRRISFTERPSGLTYGSNLAQLPAQFYYDLFSVALDNR